MLCLLFLFILFPSRDNEVTSEVNEACTPAYIPIMLTKYSTISHVREFILHNPEHVRSGTTRGRGLPAVHSTDRIDPLPTCREKVYHYGD